MSNDGSALAWVILAPVAILGAILAILVVGSFRSASRSIDVFVLSLLIVLVLNAGLLVIPQGVIFLNDLTWGRYFCHFYVWASVMLRFAEIFTTIVFGVDRVLLLRLPGKYAFHASPSVIAVAVLVWVFAVFLGAVPVAGWSQVHVHVTGPRDVNACLYLSYEIDPDFGIFVVVAEFAALLICAGCLADVYLHLRYFSNHTIFRAAPSSHLGGPEGEEDVVPGSTRTHRDHKQGATGIGVENKPSLVRTISEHTATAQGSRDFASAFDNCRLVCLLVLMIYMLNHIPYIAMSITGLIDYHDANNTRLAVLWLTLLESLLVPHLLWIINARYRAGFKRLCNALMCREPLCNTESGEISTLDFEVYEKGARESHPDNETLKTIKYNRVITNVTVAHSYKHSNGRNQIQSPVTMATVVNSLRRHGNSSSDPDLTRRRRESIYAATNFKRASLKPAYSDSTLDKMPRGTAKLAYFDSETLRVRSESVSDLRGSSQLSAKVTTSAVVSEDDSAVIQVHPQTTRDTSAVKATNYVGVQPQNRDNADKDSTHHNKLRRTKHVTSQGQEKVKRLDVSRTNQMSTSPKEKDLHRNVIETTITVENLDTEGSVASDRSSEVKVRNEGGSSPADGTANNAALNANGTGHHVTLNPLFILEQSSNRKEYDNLAFLTDNGVPLSREPSFGVSHNTSGAQGLNGPVIEPTGNNDDVGDTESHRSTEFTTQNPLTIAASKAPKKDVSIELKAKNYNNDFFYPDLQTVQMSAVTTAHNVNRELRYDSQDSEDDRSNYQPYDDVDIEDALGSISPTDSNLRSSQGFSTGGVPSTPDGDDSLVETTEPVAKELMENKSEDQYETKYPGIPAKFSTGMMSGEHKNTSDVPVTTTSTISNSNYNNSNVPKDGSVVSLSVPSPPTDLSDQHDVTSIGGKHRDIYIMRNLAPQTLVGSSDSSVWQNAQEASPIMVENQLATNQSGSPYFASAVGDPKEDIFILPDLTPRELGAGPNLELHSHNPTNNSAMITSTDENPCSTFPVPNKGSAAVPNGLADPVSGAKVSAVNVLPQVFSDCSKSDVTDRTSNIAVTEAFLVEEEANQQAPSLIQHGAESNTESNMLKNNQPRDLSVATSGAPAPSETDQTIGAPHDVSSLSEIDPSEEGLYTESQFHHLEDFLDSRGRGKVLGTYPELV